MIGKHAPETDLPRHGEGIQSDGGALANRVENERRSSAWSASFNSVESGKLSSASMEAAALAVARQQRSRSGKSALACGERLTRRSRPSVAEQTSTNCRLAIWDTVWLTAEWLMPMFWEIARSVQGPCSINMRTIGV